MPSENSNKYPTHVTKESPIKNVRNMRIEPTTGYLEGATIITP